MRIRTWSDFASGFQSLMAALLVPMLLVSYSRPLIGQTVWYVDSAAVAGGGGTSWKTAFSDLQFALLVAARGDEVWIAGGTYRPDSGSLDKAKSFIVPEGVSVYGSFSGSETGPKERNLDAHPTILSGDLLGNDSVGPAKWQDNSTHVITVGGTGSGATLLDGITIEGGFANGALHGGGIFSENADLILRQCTVRHCRGGSDGGGVAIIQGCLSSYSCEFSDNYTNTASGGAIYSFLSEIIAADCLFVRNSSGSVGGAVYASDTRSSFYRCRVLGNTGGSGSGGVDSWGPSCTVCDCLFVGNRSLKLSGAALTIEETLQVVVQRNTIAKNSCGSLGSGAGLTCLWSAAPPSLSIRDNIFWDNECPTNPDVFSNQIQFFGQLPADLSESTCNIIQGAVPATWPSSNWNLDPQFDNLAGSDSLIGTEDDDPRVSLSSPAIDSGSIPSSDSAAADLLGYPRIQDGNLNGQMVGDRGASEASNVDLVVEGDGVPGGTLWVNVVSASGMQGLLLIGSGPGNQSISPYGIVLSSLADPWILLPLGGLPRQLALHIPGTLSPGYDIYCQAVAVSSSGQTGNMSNLVVVTVVPK